MDYYILILVNDKSPILTKNNIFKALFDIGYRHNGKSWRGRFEEVITHVVVERVHSEEEAIQIVKNGLRDNNKDRKWDLILPYTELFNSKENPNGTIELFKKLKKELESKTKRLPRIIFMTDYPNSDGPNWSDFFFQYGYTNLCGDTIRHFEKNFLTEMEYLIATRQPCNLYNEEAIAATPAVKR